MHFCAKKGKSRKDGSNNDTGSDDSSKTVLAESDTESAIFGSSMLQSNMVKKMINNLQRILEAHGITQAFLSSVSGVSEKTISNLAHGVQTPRLEPMQKISKGMKDLAASYEVSKRNLRPKNRRFSDLRTSLETKQASGNQTLSD